jgi:uncharacterized protein YndB with AHSA1/START domain
MTLDYINRLGAIEREVSRRDGTDGEEVVVRIRRTYQSSTDDVWDALTSPERLPRWFLPVSGDLRPGGTFQLEGNAGGDILTCEPPEHLTVTFGGPTSVLHLHLRAVDEASTAMTLEHSVPIAMAQSGAGALFVGPGWDAAIVALELHLTNDDTDPHQAAESTELGRQSVALWVDTVRTSNTATEDEIAAVADMALAQFAPD